MTLERRRMSTRELQAQLAEFRKMAETVSNPAEAREVTSRIAELTRKFRLQNTMGAFKTPMDMATYINDAYSRRPHLDYLNEQITQAVRDVERGQNRQLAISLAPRSGKSTLLSLNTPLWMLQRHPEWSIVMTSFDESLVRGWARSVRNTIEDRPQLGIALKRDGGAGGQWETTEGGGMYSVGIGGPLTGRGARVLIIDDFFPDSAAAHNPASRQKIWDWWTSVAKTRMEPPYLVLTIATRWHEDDLIGRMLSKEWEGDPDSWQTISIPAIADNREGKDVLGRQYGDPLYSPLLVETREQALDRWTDTRRDVGDYNWSAMYQQHPSPQQGAIFAIDKLRYWTMDPTKATSDGSIVYVDPGLLGGGRWVDSWDMTFKGSASSDWVVGQRWVKAGANRYLIAQQRNQWSFTQTIDAIQVWARQSDPVLSPYGQFVHERLVENTANGPAILDTLHDKVSGLRAINPHASKEARARAVTPEIESGNVYLPHPTDDGNEWVKGLVSEIRSFPYDTHDDQVDAMTQALSFLRDAGLGGVSVPGARPYSGPTSRTISRTLGSPGGLRRF